MSPVFWTLAIELQYYLLVGLLFPLINTKRLTIRTGALICLSIGAVFLPGRPYVFHWLFLFMLGIVTFQFRTGKLSRELYLFHVAILMAGGCYNDGLVIGLAGGATALVIAFVSARLAKPWTLPGLISYSLYLIHTTIGGRVINLGERLPDTLIIELLVLAVALTVTLASSWIFFRLIEKPAQRWSAALGYKKRTAAPTGFGPRGT